MMLLRAKHFGLVTWNPGWTRITLLLSSTKSQLWRTSSWSETKLEHPWVMASSNSQIGRLQEMCFYHWTGKRYQLQISTSNSTGPRMEAVSPELPPQPLHFSHRPRLSISISLNLSISINISINLNSNILTSNSPRFSLDLVLKGIRSM